MAPKSNQEKGHQFVSWLRPWRFRFLANAKLKHLVWVRGLFELREEVNKMREASNDEFTENQVPASARGALRGKRSRKDFKGSWECSCGEVNEPWKCVLFDLPALVCGNCKGDIEEETVDMEFDFVYDQTTLNGIDILQEIKTQREGYCIQTAWTSAAEIDQNVEAVFEGKSNLNYKARSLDETDLVRKHLKCRRDILKANKSLKGFHMEIPKTKESNGSVELVGAIAKVFGIKKKGCNGGTYKISGCKEINGNDFANICKSIADGIPVVAECPYGENLKHLTCGKVYKAPGLDKYEDNNMPILAHAGVLIGAGRKRKTNYFHFLNPWGEHFCCRYTRKGRFLGGGIGKIRATDLTDDPFQLRREVRKL